MAVPNWLADPVVGAWRDGGAMPGDSMSVSAGLIVCSVGMKEASLVGLQGPAITVHARQAAHAARTRRVAPPPLLEGRAFSSAVFHLLPPPSPVHDAFQTRGTSGRREKNLFPCPIGRRLRRSRTNQRQAMLPHAAGAARGESCKKRAEQRNAV